MQGKVTPQDSYKDGFAQGFIKRLKLHLNEEQLFLFNLKFKFREIYTFLSITLAENNFQL